MHCKGSRTEAFYVHQGMRYRLPNELDGVCQANQSNPYFGTLPSASAGDKAITIQQLLFVTQPDQLHCPMIQQYVTSFDSPGFH